MVTVEDIKIAFRKLLTYTYYDKSDMCLRRNVANFTNKISRSKQVEEVVFNEIADVANGKNNPLLQQFISQMRLNYYPKELDKDDQQDEHLITNIPSNIAKIKRVLVKADVPVELLILDTLWVIKYGFLLDKELYENSFGNRLSLASSKSNISKGNALFKKYSTQYQKWWRNGLDVANKHLRNHENVTIINFDIQNYYHSVDFNFDDMINYLLSLYPNSNVANDPLTSAIKEIYDGYWKLKNIQDVDVFSGENRNKHSLPLSLLSAGVFGNWYLSSLDQFMRGCIQPLYYGRYVDDCMVVVSTKSTAQSAVDSAQEELPGVFVVKDDYVCFGINNKNILTLRIQKEKLFVYRFDCEIPSLGIERYVNDQLERSSEFRFLTDEGENAPLALERITLINSTDANNEKGRRFEVLEENKYKLSAYLAKLASRLAKYPQNSDYQSEVEKLKLYFKGSLVIKHYLFWERLLTIYVLSNHKEYARAFRDEAEKLIDNIECADALFGQNIMKGCQMIVHSLKQHLNESYIMALSLHRENMKLDRVYIDTFMIRMRFNTYPLQEFSSGFSKHGCRLALDKLRIPPTKLQYDWIPYYVPYYSIVCNLSVGKLFSPSIYERAYNIYSQLNHIDFPNGWQAFMNKYNTQKPEVEFNTDLCEVPTDKDEISISLVEIDIQEKVESFIKNFGKVDHDKIKRMQLALDKITEIRDTNIFVMPELSLPIYELLEFCQYSTKHEVAFVCGMEYYCSSRTNIVYNHTITCLPITLFGQKDAVPIIRLKNHYAPKEEMDIIAAKKRIPPQTSAQILYHWLGHVFTTYYCYELTNIQDRSHFWGKIDAMYCPVNNYDTYYFNNIAESCARDMHCYFILSNVSKYGDSRVTKPAKHDMMNLLRVKGGNTADNTVVILSCIIDIAALRAFQKKSIQEQESANLEFKFIPPGLKESDVKLRGHHFIFEDENKNCSSNRNLLRKFLRELIYGCMQYKVYYS